jgi:hypothetical protein
MKKLTLVCIAVGLISAGNSEAALTLDFSELSPRPVEGLSYMGVTFSFTVGGTPSTDATYNSNGPGITTFVQDPSLEGDAIGILTLGFNPQPTDRLQFGVALDTSDPLKPGFTVEFFNRDLISLGTTPVDTSPLSSFSEGQFVYSGAPIGQAVIDFEDSAGRFALDNLTFSDGQPLNSVPSPGALLLGSMGVALVSWLRRTRTL